MPAPADITPKTGIVILTDGVKPRLTYRAAIQPTLHRCGLHMEGLDEMLAEIESDPKDDGIHYPVFVLLGGWAQVAWVDCPNLSRGGAA